MSSLTIISRTIGRRQLPPSGRPGADDHDEPFRSFARLAAYVVNT